MLRNMLNITSMTINPAISISSPSLDAHWGVQVSCQITTGCTKCGGAQRRLSTLVLHISHGGIPVGIERDGRREKKADRGKSVGCTMGWGPRQERDSHGGWRLSGVSSNETRGEGSVWALAAPAGARRSATRLTLSRKE